jgi:adenylate cyclase
VLTVLGAVPLALGVASAGEGRVYDLLLRTRSDPGSGRVVLVAMDDATSRGLGGRNPNRTEMASVVERIWDSGADLVVLDVLFLEPHPEAEDAALERALARADCLLACSPGNGLFPLDRFRRQAVGLGSIDLLSDPDGIFRKIPTPYVDSVEGRPTIRHLPLALACARLLWFPGGAPEARMEGGTLHLGDRRFTADGTGWWIPFLGGEGTLPRVSFRDILGPGGSPQSLKDKIVLVGSTRPSQHDYFSVPLPRRFPNGPASLSSHTMAGIEVHGQALEALLAGRELVPVTGAPAWALFALVAGLGTALTSLALRPWQALALWLLVLATLAGGGVAAVRAGRPLPLLGLLLGTLLFAGGSFAYHRACDYRERRAVEGLFSRYVSPNIAKTLLSNPGIVQLGGRRKELSILFSDIRGFTSLSEDLPPERVSLLLNEYFTEMTETLFAHDGTLDKYIGDAILAFFGDPLDQQDHAARALACAVSMQERAAALRERFFREGKPPLHIGIAVTTGPVVVGNNGSKNNFAYTVIGDTVNLASRLQGLAVSDDVIVPAGLAARIPGFDALYEVETLDPVRVKGKSEEIPILRIRGRRSSREEAGARVQDARSESPAGGPQGPSGFEPTQTHGGVP